METKVKSIQLYSSLLAICLFVYRDTQWGQNRSTTQYYDVVISQVKVLRVVWENNLTFGKYSINQNYQTEPLQLFV